MHTKNKGKPKKNKTQAYSTPRAEAQAGPGRGPGPGVELTDGAWPRVQKCKENHRKNKGNALGVSFDLTTWLSTMLAPPPGSANLQLSSLGV